MLLYVKNRSFIIGKTINTFNTHPASYFTHGAQANSAFHPSGIGESRTWCGWLGHK